MSAPGDGRAARMERKERWAHFLADLPPLITNAPPLESQGKLVRVAGLVLEASGVTVPVGSVCEIHPPFSGANPQRGRRPVNAEVVGFAGDRAYLMPTDEVQGLAERAVQRAFGDERIVALILSQELIGKKVWTK